MNSVGKGRQKSTTQIEGYDCLTQYSVMFLTLISALIFFLKVKFGNIPGFYCCESDGSGRARCFPSLFLNLPTGGNCSSCVHHP